MVKHTQTIRRRNFLSMFDHFVGFALKKLMEKNWKEIVFLWQTFICSEKNESSSITWFQKFPSETLW